MLSWSGLGYLTALVPFMFDFSAAQTVVSSKSIFEMKGRLGGDSVFLGIQKIYFAWEPVLANRWHKSMQGLCTKIKNKHHALVRRSTPEEGYIVVVLLSERQDILAQTMDKVIETCHINGVGRIDSESRSFPHIDDEWSEE